MNSVKIYVKYINYVELPGILSKIVNDYSHSLLGISLFFGMYWLFTGILTEKSGGKGLLYYSDKYSYDIYIVHQIYILGAFTLIGLTGFLALDILIISVAIVISAVLLQLIRNILVYCGQSFTARILRPKFK
jgi:peptidoglycan/LPS O-acetylase OafA/YrhL